MEIEQKFNFEIASFELQTHRLKYDEWSWMSFVQMTSSAKGLPRYHVECINQVAVMEFQFILKFSHHQCSSIEAHVRKSQINIDSTYLSRYTASHFYL